MIEGIVESERDEVRVFHGSRERSLEIRIYKKD